MVESAQSKAPPVTFDPQNSQNPSRLTDRGAPQLGQERVQVPEPLEAGDLFADLGVVLHGAGAERIEAVVHTNVTPGELGEMPDDVNLGEFAQTQIGGAPVLDGNLAGGGNIVARQVYAATSGDRFVENY